MPTEHADGSRQRHPADKEWSCTPQPRNTGVYYYPRITMALVHRVGQPNKWPKNPGNALSDALVMSSSENFAADAAKKTSFSCGFNQFINSNRLILTTDFPY